jgi:hypothetical protein
VSVSQGPSRVESGGRKTRRDRARDTDIEAVGMVGPHLAGSGFWQRAVDYRDVYACFLKDDAVLENTADSFAAYKDCQCAQSIASSASYRRLLAARSR